MPDPDFHKRAGALRLSDIARVAGVTPAAGAEGSFILEDVAPLDKAGPRDLSFFDNIRYRAQFEHTKARACFARPECAAWAPPGVHVLVTPNPYKAYALAAQAFYPEAPPAARIAASAIIDPSAVLGEGCVVEENVVIMKGARIGKGCWIEAGAVIRENVSIGDHSRIGIHCGVSHARIGAHVRLYPGVRVGQDGFGFAIDPSGPVKIPQLGRVLIEDGAEIGANSTVDRGAGPDTVIGQGTWIDNLVQIAHNVTIGKYCIIAAQTGVSGSVHIEDFVAIGGQVGISGHVTIGRGARLAAKSGVIGDVPPGAEVMGYPARPKRQFLKGAAMLNRLIEREKSS